MKLVKENINFKRGEEPKDSMNTGLTDIEKIEMVIQELKKFGIDATWSRENEPDKGKFYQIYSKEDKHTTMIYTELVRGQFDSWTDSKTSNPIEAVKQIIDAIYPNLESEILKTQEHLEQLNKMRAYLNQ